MHRPLLSHLHPCPPFLLLLACILAALDQQHLRCSSLAPNTAVQFHHFLSSDDVGGLNAYLDRRLRQSTDEGGYSHSTSLARRLVASKGPVDYVQSGYDQLHGTSLKELRRLCDVYDRVRDKVTAVLRDNVHGSVPGAVWQQHASFQVYHENGFHAMHADTDIDKRCVTASVGLDSHRDGDHAGGRFVVYDPRFADPRDPQHSNRTATHQHPHTSHSEAGSLVVFRAESLHGVEKVTRGIRRVLHVWYGCERPRCSDSRCTPLQSSPRSLHPIVRRASADRIDPMVVACEAIKESYSADAADNTADNSSTANDTVAAARSRANERLMRVSGCRIVGKKREDDIVWCDHKRRSSGGPDPPFPNVRSDSDL